MKRRAIISLLTNTNASTNTHRIRFYLTNGCYFIDSGILFTKDISSRSASVWATQTQTIPTFTRKVSEMFTVSLENEAVFQEMCLEGKLLVLRMSSKPLFKMFHFSLILILLICSMHKSRSHELCDACDVHCTLYVTDVIFTANVYTLT